jgi:hypothetical protein
MQLTDTPPEIQCDRQGLILIHGDKDDHQRFDAPKLILFLEN